MIDVGYMPVFFIIGLLMLVALYTIPRLVKERKRRAQYLDQVDFGRTIYNDMEESDLRRIINNLNVSYPVLLVIYGILLAFVVSDKIILTLQSSYFVIWCGWILAIIVRSGMIVISLFDLGDITSKKTVGRTIEDAKKFFKMAIILLIPTVAFLPAVYVEHESDSKVENLWTHELSITTIAFSIIISFVVFFLVPLRPLSFARKTGYFDLLFFVVPLIVLGAIVGKGSPLDPVEITLGNNIATIPGGLYNGFLVLTVGFFMVMLVWYLSIFRETSDHKKRR